MAEVPLPTGPRTVNYSSNSKNTPVAKTEIRSLPEKVVSGVVIEHKKSLGRKFREQFAGDDMRTVGLYLLMDVIMPATKNLIFDLGTEGLKRALFGGTMPVGNMVRSSLNQAGRTNYKAYSGGISSPVGETFSKREISPQQRAMHDFSGVILESREQAIQVLDVLTSLIEEYGVATLNDYYACVGITSNFPDAKYGWKSLNTATVRGIREGYLLDMPKPIVLE